MLISGEKEDTVLCGPSPGLPQSLLTGSRECVEFMLVRLKGSVMQEYVLHVRAL